MKCRPGWGVGTVSGGGELLFTLQPLPTILSSKSFFSFSQPVHFHRVSAGLLILAPFTLGWARWAPDSWHYPCTLSCGIDLALLLLGMYCLMISRAVIGGGLWGWMVLDLHNRPSNPTLVAPFGLIKLKIQRLFLVGFLYLKYLIRVFQTDVFHIFTASDMNMNRLC